MRFVIWFTLCAFMKGKEAAGLAVALTSGKQVVTEKNSSVTNNRLCCSTVCCSASDFFDQVEIWIVTSISYYEMEERERRFTSELSHSHLIGGSGAKSGRILRSWLSLLILSFRPQLSDSATPDFQIPTNSRLTRFQLQSWSPFEDLENMIDLHFTLG